MDEAKSQRLAAAILDDPFIKLCQNSIYEIMNRCPVPQFVIEDRQFKPIPPYDSLPPAARETVDAYLKMIEDRHKSLLEVTP